MKRAILLAFTSLWILVLFRLWEARRPLLTTIARSTTDGLRVAGFNDEGNVVLARCAMPTGRRRSAAPNGIFGPLTLHSMSTGRELATLMSDDEMIRELRIDVGLIVTGDPGDVRVRAFGPERPLIEISGGTITAASLSPSGAKLLLQKDHVLRVHDVQSGRILWSQEGVAQAHWAGESAVAVQPSAGSTSTSILDSETGESRGQTAMGFPRPSEGEWSPDGQYVWWAGARGSDAAPGLYDITTNQRLWGLDHPSVRQFTPEQSRYFTFSNDSREMRVLYVTRGDLFAVARWRTKDAEVIHAPPPNALLLVDQFRVTKSLSANGQWQVSGFSRPLLTRRVIPAAAQAWLARKSAWINSVLTTLYSDRPFVRIIHVPTGTVQGETERLAPAVVVEPDDRGFVFHGGATVTRIDLPPRTDYGWLIRWALLPPAVIIGALEARWWRRRRAAVALPPETLAV